MHRTSRLYVTERARGRVRPSLNGGRWDSARGGAEQHGLPDQVADDDEANELETRARKLQTKVYSSREKGGFDASRSNGRTTKGALCCLSKFLNLT